MNTNFLMTSSALFLGISGLGLTFLPQEIATFFEAEINQTFILTLQILGSLYLGFGMMNWMTKNGFIGGIYNRPLVFGNLLHFLISAFALVKLVGNYSGKQFVIICTISIFYSLFALSFAYLIRTNPTKPQDLD